MSGEYVHCPLCGALLAPEHEGARARMTCPSCGFVHYRNPAPAVGVLIVEDARVLLVRRRFEPFKGLWSIPSGFVEYDEDVRTTGVREALEETGLEVELGPLHSVQSCFDDPRGNALLILYRARVAGGALRAGDDAEDVRYFPLGELPEVAFEAHRAALAELASEATRSRGR
jgi:8-oxo-dGTP diphosphatase